MLDRLSHQLGTGDLQRDVLIACVALAIVSFLIAVRGFLRSGRRGVAADEGFDRVSGLIGRIEKLEMTINEFKTESLRSFEFFRGDMGFLKQELEELRHSMGAAKGRGSGGDKGGSGGGLGGPGSTGGQPPPFGSGGFGGPAPSGEQSLSEVLSGRKMPESTEKKTLESAGTGLGAKLSRTRGGIFQKLKGLFSGKPKLEPEMLEDLEAQLVSSDLGIRTTTSLLDELRRDVASGVQIGEGALAEALKRKVLNVLEADAPLDAHIRPERRSDGPTVVLVVGVNGAGKTTTVAKLATKWKDAGARVLMVAADTFRAAAVDQLVEWGQRIGVPVVSGAHEAKPATVVFDAMKRAQSEEFDVIIIDTAGRLHTKTSLMQELEGIKNTVQRHQASAPHETLLVIDGSTGGNALSQAKVFHEATPLSGLVVTKLDGTPKGGIVVAIKSELGVPVRYIGVGESSEDLRIFSAREFVEALFDTTQKEFELGQQSAHGETRRRRRQGTDFALV